MRGLAPSRRGTAQFTTRLWQKLEVRFDNESSCDRAGELAQQLELARKEEPGSQALARVVRTLSQWFGHDVLSLAGPDVAVRQEMFDFVAAELHGREHADVRRIRPMRVALQNQRDGLLAFARVLDGKLVAVSVNTSCPPHRSCVRRKRRPPAAVDNSAPMSNPQGSTYRSQFGVRTTGATSL